MRTMPPHQASKDPGPRFRHHLMQPYSTINSPLALCDSGPSPPTQSLAPPSGYLTSRSRCYWEYPFHLLDLIVIIKQLILLSGRRYGCIWKEVEQANEARKPCARISRGRVTLRWWGIPCFLFFWAPLKLVLTAHPLFFTGTHLFCRERLSRLYRSPGFSSPRSGNHPETGEGDGGIILALRG
jgi:hypothetical protein